MKVLSVKVVNESKFFEAVDNTQFQNYDIREAIDFGYKNVQDAFKQAELLWARFYLVYSGKELITAILEQRDGVIFFYTTVHLKDTNLRLYVKKLRILLNKVLKCRDVLFTINANWYKNGAKLLRLTGFRKWKIHNDKTIWIAEYGK